MNINKVNKIVRSDRTIQINVGEDGESFTLTYNRQGITGKVERELKDKSESGLPVCYGVEILSKLIVSWDLMYTPPGKDKRGNAFPDIVLPLDDTSLLEEVLGPETIEFITNEIFRDMNPNQKRSPLTNVSFGKPSSNKKYSP